jgi:hypothetical protein
MLRVLGRLLLEESISMYTVEIGRYTKGSYKVRWRFDNETQAVMYFNGINVGRGYKKRIRKDGKTIARVFSEMF